MIEKTTTNPTGKLTTYEEKRNKEALKSIQAKIDLLPVSEEIRDIILKQSEI